jgi:uncharacterized protein YceH (UPF0502 family)
LGCLVEKEATTPDVYPLTLNGLTAACNQKSSRDPVMTLSEAEVEEALDGLIDKTLASNWNSNRNRIQKYRHCLHDRISEEFSFTREELAVVATLLLRGPQTVGEIRTRCVRLHDFPDLAAVQAVVSELESDRRGGPYVVLLPRQPGRKEQRIAHLLCGPVTAEEAPTGDDASPVATAIRSPDQVERLEQEVAELRSELGELKSRFEEFTRQFD